MGLIVDTDKIRNIAIAGHTGCGKTMLLESILYDTNVISQKGSIDKGNTISDYTEEEKNRKISLKTAVASIKYNDFKLNILDTPGSADFSGEVRAAFRVSDGVIFVIDGEAGVQIETIKQWNLADKYNLPRLVFINKLDKPNADFFKVVEDLKNNFKKTVIPVELPIVEKNEIVGVVDLIEKNAYTLKNGKLEKSDIPEYMKNDVESYYDGLMEAVAEASDDLIEKYLNGEQLTKDEMLSAFRKTVSEYKFIPIICGSVEKNIGVVSLLRISTEAFPSPMWREKCKGIDPKNSNEIERVLSKEEPFTGLCFKTIIDPFLGRLSFLKIIAGVLNKDEEILISNKDVKIKISKLLSPVGNKFNDIDKGVTGDIVVIQKIDQISTSDTLCDKNNPIVLPPLDLPQAVYSVAISTSDKKHEEKLISALQKYSEEDPTLSVKFNPETKQNVVSGMGELHLDVYFSMIRKQMKIDFKTEIPKINYKETIRKEVEARYRHKKQSGGHGQFGEVAIKVMPAKRGEGFKFVNKIVGGVIPKQFIPGVEKGLIEGMEEGVLAKYPVVDIVVELFDGAYHPVDSSEMSFKIAARTALKNAMQNGDPVILEPIMKLRVYAPDKYTGDIISDLNSKRGRVQGMEPLPGQNTLIKAEVPHAELLRYAIDLKSLTQGTGSFEIEFDHYNPITGKLAEQVIEARKRDLEQE